MSKLLTQSDYANAATMFNCEIAAIKAVAEVESTGDGFLKSGQPKILFERHWFSRLTKREFDSTHPAISKPSPGGYMGGEAEHKRLQEAAKLDRDAALKSASWGKVSNPANL